MINLLQQNKETNTPRISFKSKLIAGKGFSEHLEKFSAHIPKIEEFKTTVTKDARNFLVEISADTFENSNKARGLATSIDLNNLDERVSILAREAKIDNVDLLTETITSSILQGGEEAIYANRVLNGIKNAEKQTSVYQKLLEQNSISLTDLLENSDSIKDKNFRDSIIKKGLSHFNKKVQDAAINKAYNLSDQAMAFSLVTAKTDSLIQDVVDSARSGSNSIKEDIGEMSKKLNILTKLQDDPKIYDYFKSYMHNIGKTFMPLPTDSYQVSDAREAAIGVTKMALCEMKDKDKVLKILIDTMPTDDRGHLISDTIRAACKLGDRKYPERIMKEAEKHIGDADHLKDEAKYYPLLSDKEILDRLCPEDAFEFLKDQQTKDEIIFREIIKNKENYDEFPPDEIDIFNHLSAPGRIKAFNYIMDNKPESWKKWAMSNIDDIFKSGKEKDNLIGNWIKRETGPKIETDYRTLQDIVSSLDSISEVGPFEDIARLITNKANACLKGKEINSKEYASIKDMVNKAEKKVRTNSAIENSQNPRYNLKVLTDSNQKKVLAEMSVANPNRLKVVYENFLEKIDANMDEAKERIAALFS